MSDAKANPTLRRGSGTRSTPARSAVAAGAARASGERARRRTTPLLSGLAPVEPLIAADPPVEPSTTEPAPVEPPTTEPAPVEPPTTEPASVEPPTTESAPEAPLGRPAHRPRPVVTSGIQKKAVAQSGERRRTPRPSRARPPVGVAERTAERTAEPTAKPTATPRSDPRKAPASRPRMTPAAPPTEPARTPRPAAAGTPARRATPARPAQPPEALQASRRGSAKARRAADERARSHLRIARPPEPAPALSPAPDPTIVGLGDSALPAPGVEELLGAAISAMRLAAQGAGIAPEDIERRIAQTLAYLRRRIDGDYVVDEFGYDADFAESILFPLLRPIYRHWFRVETRGVENIPAQGGALVVANHSGTIAIDSLMVQLAIHDEHPRNRVMRALGADLVFQAPFLGTLSRRGGATLATNADADRLFAKGELVGVFPEGFKGVGKPFKERYKLQRFGRGGFVSAALKAGVPIIPVSVVGAEEIAPIIGNMKTLARILGVPYAPVTPTFPWLGPLGLIPLPSKWIIEFGAPIDTEGFGAGAADDPMLVFDLTDQVRETIQQTLYSLLMQRRSVFF